MSRKVSSSELNCSTQQKEPTTNQNNSIKNYLFEIKNNKVISIKQDRSYDSVLNFFAKIKNFCCTLSTTTERDVFRQQVNKSLEKLSNIKRYQEGEFSAQYQNKSPANDEIEFEKLQFKGRGKLVFANNTKYEGGFKNGKPDDENGVLKFSQKTIYSGGLKDGHFYGRGVLVTGKDADVPILDIENGKLITDDKNNGKLLSEYIREFYEDKE